MCIVDGGGHLKDTVHTKKFSTIVNFNVLKLVSITFNKIFLFIISSLFLPNTELRKIPFMSNMLFNQALNLSSYKNVNFLRSIKNSIYHISNSERNMTHKIWQYVTRNTEFTDAVVTFELQTAQQLN
jgi:hypothetical protein